MPFKLISGIEGIKLGPLWNKYLIIKVLLYAADGVYIKEVEKLLWSLSKAHRAFLFSNRCWYPRLLVFPERILRKQGGLTSEQADFLLSNIRGFKVHQATLIYRASDHGWGASDFHRHCDGKGPTLSIFRTPDCLRWLREPAMELTVPPM